MKTIYDNNNHSVFSLNYHLILVIKYRRKVISEKIKQRLIEIFEYICDNYNISAIEINSDLDHLHVLFKAHPNSELSKFINAYKSATSRLIKKEFPEIKDSLWADSFWSKSFFLATTGGVTLDTLKQYIETQGEKAWRLTFIADISIGYILR
jgi:transposase IS200-family protein